jgi:hypothetical protein
MSSRVVGFDRELRRKWLDETARLQCAGLSEKEIKQELDAVLEGYLSGSSTTRSAKGKTVTVLTRLWARHPKSTTTFRDEALVYFQKYGVNSVILHWGLALAAYPFFQDTTENIGRLLSLQGSFSVTQLQRRVREKYGERETVYRAANRLVQSISEWGIIQETSIKRTFEGKPPISVEDSSLAIWLLEAALLASGNNSAPFYTLVKSPALFPFKLANLNAASLNQHPRLQIFRQGVDEDVVMFKK